MQQVLDSCRIRKSRSKWHFWLIAIQIRANAIPIYLFGFLATILPISSRLPIAYANEQSIPPVLSDTMDGPQKAMRALTQDSRLVIKEHFIDQNSYQFGTGSEHLRYICPAGTSAKFAYRIPASSIIDESKISIRLSCSQVGVRIAALVVLPRTWNEDTGKPIELLLRSFSFGSANNWQELLFENLSEELNRQARVARMHHGKDLDQREAYISQIVVLAPGGNGTNELIVDRIQLFGVVDSIPQKVQTDPKVKLANGIFPSTSQSASENLAKISTFMPQRVIQWQGEELEYLAELGFDGIQIGRPPTSRESQEAQRLRLALVCTPPDPQHLTEYGIETAHSAVSVWDIGEQYTPSEIELTQRWNQLIKRFDPLTSRPVMISAGLYPREASRIGDQLLLKRSILYTDLSLHEYATWLNGRKHLARPGTPIWTSIESQLPQAAEKQVETLFPAAKNVLVADYFQLVAMTSVAISAKSEGFYFQSHSSLENQDLSTKIRSLNLELLNQRLKLISPWLSKGKMRASARSNIPGLSALDVQVERSHLLIPIRWSMNLHDKHQLESKPISFVVPEAIESSEAYLLTLAGPKRIRHERVTGGVRVSIDQLPQDSLILLTDDQQAFTQISRYLRSIAPRATHICKELIQMKLQETIHVFQKLNSRLTNAQQAQQLIGQSQRELQLCNQFLEKRDFQQAYQKIFLAKSKLDECESLLIEQMNFDENTSLTVIPDQLNLNKLASLISQSQNQLPFGSFEDLSSLLKAGWKQQRLELEGINTAVRLAPNSPHSGRFCLELEASSKPDSPHNRMIPSAPVWITSPSIPVTEGMLIEITGYARVSSDLLGTVDGLQIIDSLGGYEMATRITNAQNWKAFRIIRKANNSTELSISLVLSGIGVAQVDDLSVRTLAPDPAPSRVQASRFMKSF